MHDPSGSAGAASRGCSPTERPVCSHCHKVGHDVSKCSTLHVCAQCKKLGHDISKCYELIGYPEGLDPKARSTKPSAGRGRGSVAAHATAVVGAAASTSSLPSSSAIFSPEQWQALAGIIFGSAKLSDNKLNGAFSSSSWIIDSGATHHVTGECSNMFDLVTIAPCSVGLPNGSTAMATQKGSVAYLPLLLLLTSS